MVGVAIEACGSIGRGVSKAGIASRGRIFVAQKALRGTRMSMVVASAVNAQAASRSRGGGSDLTAALRHTTVIATIGICIC